MKRIILLLIVATVVLTSNAIAQPKYVKDAYKSFNTEKYFESSTKCTDAFAKLGVKGDIKTKGDMAYKAAESFRLTEVIKDLLIASLPNPKAIFSETVSQGNTA